MSRKGGETWGTPALHKNTRFAQKSLVCPNILPFAQIFGGGMLFKFWNDQLPLAYHRLFERKLFRVGAVLLC